MVPLTDAPMISMFAESGPLNFFPVVVCTCAKYNLASAVLIGLLKRKCLMEGMHDSSLHSYLTTDVMSPLGIVRTGRFDDE